MGVVSWLKSKFTIEKENHISASFQEIPIFKTETPEKIIETRIRPVKIPTILDLGEKLTFLSSNISSLKDDIITKSWFLSQYEDASAEILNRLDGINDKLNDIKNFLMNTKNLTKNLSDMPFRSFTSNKRLTASDMILFVLKENTRVRYKDIVSMVPYSDPTISSHIKILLKNKRIKKSKIGKAVYYELT